jgi:Family of unknown function (DUF6314)
VQMPETSRSWRPGGGTLDFLHGRWHADRQISDRRSGTAGTFRGEAVFSRSDSGGLTYLEEGELSFGGHTGPARRSLLYVPGQGGGAEVLFADRRPFYRLDLHSGSWAAEHLCGEDRYIVTVSVLSADAFTERWQAGGPGKDYEMTTTLARIGPRA